MTATPFDFPTIELPESTEILRAEVREFLAAERARGTVLGRADSWFTGWDSAFTRRLAERGWIGMALPKRYGGHDRGALDRYVVIEELLAAGAPVSAHWVADRQAGPSILRNGTEAQKQRFLPAIGAGRCFFSIGMSEEHAGSDLAAVRTRAERIPGGWRLTGTKRWTGGAHVNDYAIVLARTDSEATDRHAGLSQFIVDLRAPVSGSSRSRCCPASTPSTSSIWTASRSVRMRCSAARATAGSRSPANWLGSAAVPSDSCPPFRC